MRTEIILLSHESLALEGQRAVPPRTLILDLSFSCFFLPYNLGLSFRFGLFMTAWKVSVQVPHYLMTVLVLDLSLFHFSVKAGGQNPWWVGVPFPGLWVG